MTRLQNQRQFTPGDQPPGSTRSSRPSVDHAPSHAKNYFDDEPTLQRTASASHGDEAEPVVSDAKNAAAASVQRPVGGSAAGRLTGGATHESVFDLIDLASRHLMNIVPMALGVHALLMLGGALGNKSFVAPLVTVADLLPWILASLLIGLGVLGYTGIFRRPAAAGLRVLLLVGFIWGLCLHQGGYSLFTGYLFVLVSIYPIFMHQRYGLAIPWIAAAAYLSLSVVAGSLSSVMSAQVGWDAGLLVLIGHLACGLGLASQHYRQLHKLAHTDELTGLSNRRHFRESVERELELVRRDGRPLTLITYDLDNFKQINDQHGHPSGDAVLRHFADLLRINTRRNDVVARIGGDEFAVVLPDMSADSAESYVQSILDTLSLERIAIPGGTIQLSASAGVVTADRKGPFDIHELMRRSDENLYRSKRSRRRGDADSERRKRSLLLRPRNGVIAKTDHSSLPA